MRLQHRDYSEPGAYFITICTRERECLFGDVVDGVMLLNDFGCEVEAVWNELPSRYDGLGLDQFVVMPNHAHGVLVLAEDRSSISEIIRTLKGLSAYRINLRRKTPGVTLWQRGFYDHVVRDGADLSRIREYIDSNPMRWALDEENPARVPVATP